MRDDMIIAIDNTGEFQLPHEVNHANIASALHISRSTVGRYIETLERMFLIDTLPGSATAYRG